MGDYSSYFGNSTTYSSPYANTYSTITGAETTYNTYPAPGASVSTAYAATTPGTTYTSYTLNPTASTQSTASTTYNYVDWASAATAAAISSAATANRGSHEGSKTKLTKQNWYNRTKANAAAGKEPPRTYYCEICKVSCMGALTYKEHCNGQKHKKKEKEKEGGDNKPARGYHSFGKLYRCELCDISCTGEQAFSAHMTGSKHNKTVLLFRKLGKVIPNPTVTNNKGEKEEVDLEKVKEELAKKAERIAKEEADRTEKRNKRNQQAEERAKKRLEEIEARRKMMDERRSKWEEERWKREEEWRNMQEQREEEWKQWQETEQSEITPGQVHQSAGFASREGDNNDNKLIMKLHDEIYPDPTELTNIKNLVKVTEDNLKTISDTMRDETEAELKDKGLLKEPVEGEEVVETRVLKGCVRVGDLANGLLLKGDKTLEMLVFCTDKPTVYLLQNVKEKFEELLTEAQKKALKVTVEPSKGAFIVTDPKDFSVTITMTSKAMEADATAASITADVAAKVLDRKNCLRVLEELKHANWFQANVSPVPSAVIALRVLHYIMRQEDKQHWRDAAKPWILDVLIGQLLQANQGRRFSPGDIIRRILEAISAGVLFSSNSSIPDPCTEPSVDLIQSLDRQAVEKVTMDAQAGLRALAFNKIHEFLGVAVLSEQEAAAEEVVEQEPGTGMDSQDFEGYDGAAGHNYPSSSHPVRMRGMRMRRPPHPGARPYGPPGYGGGHHHRQPPYGPGPYGHGPPPFPTHLGPRGPWRGPPPHMRRGGPPPFGPRGRGGYRMRGPRPNNKNRKRKPEEEDTKEDVKKECVEKSEGEEGTEGDVKVETPDSMDTEAA